MVKFLTKITNLQLKKYTPSAYGVRQACQTRVHMRAASVKFQLENLPRAAIWLERKMKANEKSL